MFGWSQVKLSWEETCTHEHMCVYSRTYPPTDTDEGECERILNNPRQIQRSQVTARFAEDRKMVDCAPKGHGVYAQAQATKRGWVYYG